MNWFRKKPDKKVIDWDKVKTVEDLKLIVLANLCGLGSTYKGCTYKIRGDMLTADVCKGLDKLLIEEEQK